MESNRHTPRPFLTWLCAGVFLALSLTTSPLSAEVQTVAVFDPLAPVEIPLALTGMVNRQLEVSPTHGTLSATVDHWVYFPGETFTEAGGDHFVVKYLSPLGNGVQLTRIVRLIAVPTSHLQTYVEDFESGAAGWIWPSPTEILSLFTDPHTGNTSLLATFSGPQSYIEQNAPTVCTGSSNTCVRDKGTSIIENCGTVDPDPGDPDPNGGGHGNGPQQGTGSAVIFETTAGGAGPYTRIRLRVTDTETSLRAEIRPIGGSWVGTRWMAIDPEEPSEFRLRMGASHDAGASMVNNLRFAVGVPGQAPDEVAMLRGFPWTDFQTRRWGPRDIVGLDDFEVRVDDFVEVYGEQDAALLQTHIEDFETALGSPWQLSHAGGIALGAGNPLQGEQSLEIQLDESFASPPTTAMDLQPSDPSSRLDASFHLRADGVSFAAIGDSLELLTLSDDAGFFVRPAGFRLIQTVSGLALQAWLLDTPEFGPSTIEYSPTTLLSSGDHRVDISWITRGSEGETLVVWLDGNQVATLAGNADGHKIAKLRFGAWNPNGGSPQGFHIPGTLYLDSFSATYSDGGQPPR